MVIEDIILRAIREDGVEIGLKNLDTFTLSNLIRDTSVRALQSVQDILDNHAMDDADCVREIAAVLARYGMDSARWTT